MKFVAILSSLLLSGFAAAQDQQSKPFNLIIKASDNSLDGQKFSACHTGAAIESLCISGDKGSEFFFNTTKGSNSPLDGYEPSSTLVWNLPIGNGEPVSEPMSFYYDPSTNVALPLFQPTETRQYVTVDKNDQLALFSNSDDTVTPPVSTKTTALKNWYVCESYYLGYQYHTLNWVAGTSKVKPQNPSCVKVDVQRKFV